MEDKHILFAEKYLELMNGTAAYMAVYQDSTYDSAMRSASRLLRNAEVKAYIKARLEGHKLSVDEVLAGISELAMDKSDKKVRLQALTQLGKVHGIFQEKLDITSKGERIGWAEFIAKSE